MKNTMKLMLWLAALAVLLALILAIPLAWIWAPNTLFTLGIEYTFWTWLAALLLGMLVGSGVARI